MNSVGAPTTAYEHYVEDLERRAKAVGVTAQELERAECLVEKANPKKPKAQEPKPASAESSNVQAVLRAYATINPEPLSWLWPGRLPLGKLTVIAGDPGFGKSLLTVDIAAHVTTGKAFPDGEPCATGDVVLVSAEDDPDDTIRPRLEAAGADLSRVFDLSEIVIKGSRESNDRRRGFSLSDIPALESAVSQLNADNRKLRLVVIDPVSAYLGETDSNSNGEIRGILRPLAELAREMRLTILFITHLRKGSAERAQYRVSGTLGLVAASRAAWLVAEDSDEADRRIFAPLKMNLASKPDSRAFRVVSKGDVAVIEWDPSPIETDADEILDRERADDHTARQDAAEWLESLLKDGPRAAKEVYELAGHDRIAERTLNRAKKKLGVKSTRSDGNGPWSWSLPDCHAATSPAAETWQPGNVPEEGRGRY